MKNLGMEKHPKGNSSWSGLFPHTWNIQKCSFQAQLLLLPTIENDHIVHIDKSGTSSLDSVKFVKSEPFEFHSNLGPCKCCKERGTEWPRVEIDHIFDTDTESAKTRGNKGLGFDRNIRKKRWKHTVTAAALVNLRKFVIWLVFLKFQIWNVGCERRNELVEIEDWISRKKLL